MMGNSFDPIGDVSDWLIFGLYFIGCMALFWESADHCKRSLAWRMTIYWLASILGLFLMGRYLHHNGIVASWLFTLNHWSLAIYGIVHAFVTRAMMQTMKQRDAQIAQLTVENEKLRHESAR